MKKNYIGITGFTEKIQVLDTMNFIKDIKFEYILILH